MFLKAKEKIIPLHLGICKKLAPKFCGPLEIQSRIGPMAYELALPPSIKIHNVFHVSLLKKYVHDPNDILNFPLIHVEPEGEI